VMDYMESTAARDEKGLASLKEKIKEIYGIIVRIRKSEA